MTTSSDSRPCPSCGEPVLTAARKCRFCGEWFDADMRAATRARGQGERAVDVPLVLKVWGGLLMGGSALLAALQVAQAAVVTFSFGVGGAGFGGGLFIGMAIGLGIALLIHGVFIRMGWGLWRGQRMSVIGVGVLGVLGFGLGALMLADGAGSPGWFVLGFTAVACVPPVAAGAAAWGRLR